MNQDGEKKGEMVEEKLGQSQKLRKENSRPSWGCCSRRWMTTSPGLMKGGSRLLGWGHV